MSDKLAVCIGNNYPGTAYTLSGCVNDARDWTELLTAQGYDVVTMTDVGKADMLAVLAGNIDRLGYGDRFVFTYSGHGTWVPDVNGDEADGRDEALVGADLVPILDDELQAVFDQVPEHAGALILSDSCHSGTVSRFVDLPAAGPLPGALEPGQARPRFVPPTVFARGLSEARAVELEDQPPSPPRRTANLLAAARDDEYAWDAWFGDRANGAFTRVAIDAFEDGISLAAWHKRIAGRLPTEQYPQHPQMTASSEYRRYADAL